LNLNQVILAEGSVQSRSFYLPPSHRAVFFRNDAGYRAKPKETADKSSLPKPGSKQWYSATFGRNQTTLNAENAETL